MVITNIALGLVGLGVVVFVHELGHFIAARLAGIDVEAFSIGWGKPILKKKVGEVEYRLGMFPVGGYCKMRGHDEIKGAIETDSDKIEPTKGTFYGASPVRRILVCFAGPLFNLVFAAIVLSIIWGVGFEFNTLENRIVLASELTGAVSPADEAGLRSGDRIVEINGRQTDFFHEVREGIAMNPERLLALTVDRDGETVSLSVRPDLDRNTGAGVIGVMPWTDTVVAHIVPDSDAALAGLLPGDRIVRMNDIEVINTVDVMRVLGEGPAHITVEYVRGGAVGRAELLVTQAGAGLGIGWPRVQFRTPRLSPPAALVRGVQETWRTLAVSIHSLSLLFRGINLAEAVSGPLRITYMVGDVAAAGFGHSGIMGLLRSMADFLALISIAIAVMNLLPLPVLDGGQIILYTVELIRGKPTHPRALRAFQTAGVVLIFGLMLFALFGDIMFLGGRIGSG